MMPTKRLLSMRVRITTPATYYAHNSTVTTTKRRFKFERPHQEIGTHTQKPTTDDDGTTTNDGTTNDDGWNSHSARYHIVRSSRELCSNASASYASDLGIYLLAVGESRLPINKACFSNSVKRVTK